MDLFSNTFNFKKFQLPEGIEKKLLLPDIILGKQAEVIFEHILTTTQVYTLLTANKQIQGATETLGELDYLVEHTQTRKQLHIEIACKFYLFDNENHSTFEGKWIGPNRKDTLLDKITKLKNKQFPLLRHPNTQKMLQSIGFNSKEAEQCYYLFSSLYIPKDYDITLLPKNYQNCIVGYWVNHTKLTLDNKCLYAMPNKKEWLLPAENITSWYSAINIAPKISEMIQNKRAPQLYKKKGTQIEKFFVVWW